MKMQLEEVRRLTGPNFLWDKPGALVDVLLSESDSLEDKKGVAECWQKWLQTCLDDFGWSAQRSTYRLHQFGASLAVSAPLDALYTACELAELAWHCAAAEMASVAIPDWQSRLQELRVELADEVNPQLLAILAAAKERNVSCLTDDDELSLGLGASAEVWPARDLPDISQLQWQQYTNIPSAFITGTNGKSTSVRLAAEIAKAAGFTAGLTSTDFIRVGDQIIERGDYSGPGGARMLLRDKRCDFAFMEVARGGLLRRGLPVNKVDAALITNVASDHLGQYGVNTVEELAETKFIVAKALADKGSERERSSRQDVLVVNADNALVVEQAANSAKRLCWFSRDEHNLLIQRQFQTGGQAVFVRAGIIIYHSSGLFEEVAVVTEVPMTFNGTAIHNIENALGVIGLCRALKLPMQAIRQGLTAFGSNAEDNPGRGNLYQVNGCKVVVDFAHNEHSMRAVVKMVRQMPANNRIVLFGHGGDRSDQDIRNLTNAVADLQASLYLVTELEVYLRGRQLGEIPTLVGDTLSARQIPTEIVLTVANPLEGAKQAVAAANPGDVVLLFVLDQREQVHQWLSEVSEP